MTRVGFQAEPTCSKLPPMSKAAKVVAGLKVDDLTERQAKAEHKRLGEEWDKAVLRMTTEPSCQHDQCLAGNLDCGWGETAPCTKCGKSLCKGCWRLRTKQANRPAGTT